MGNSNEGNKNYNKKTSKKTTNNTNLNKKASTVDEVEHDLEIIGTLIKLVNIIFVVAAIGIFIWFIGKDLVKAIDFVNFGTDELDRESYTTIIKELKEEEL